MELAEKSELKTSFQDAGGPVLAAVVPGDAVVAGDGVLLAGDEVLFSGVERVASLAEGLSGTAPDD